MLTNLTRLTEDSISLYDGTVAYYPKTDTSKPIVGISDVIEEFGERRVYCVENGILGTIFGDSFLVTPYTRQKVSCLKKEGFEEAKFFVPFSDGSFPSLNKKTWEALLEDAAYYEPHSNP